MDPHFRPVDNGHSGSPFPLLPIVKPDPPRLSQREKFGGLFYMGILGLVVAFGIVGWFAYSAWSLRDLWSNVYVLHDGGRSEAGRIQAAFDLSRDPRLNQRQRWDMCLRRPLPPLARYLLAESLTAEAASAAPRDYALSVARSPDWPDWLRLLLTRPMAYAATQGVKFPRDALTELAGNHDRAIGLWAAFTLAQQDPDDHASLETIEAACGRALPDRGLACLLVEAIGRRGHPEIQSALLDRATRWLAAHHPEAVALGSDWKREGGKITPRSAPELQ